MYEFCIKTDNGSEVYLEPNRTFKMGLSCKNSSSVLAVCCFLKEMVASLIFDWVLKIPLWPDVNHGTIIRTGITCKKIPCYMRDAACRWFIVKKFKIFRRYVRFYIFEFSWVWGNVEFSLVYTNKIF